MELNARGGIEKFLDSMTPEQLKQTLEMFESRMPMKSKEDFLTGYIIGYTYAALRIEKMVHKKPDVTPSEIEEYKSILERRFMEIKGKIKMALET